MFSIPRSRLSTWERSGGDSGGVRPTLTAGEGSRNGVPALKVTAHDKPNEANRTPGVISGMKNRAEARGPRPDHSSAMMRGTNSRQPPAASASAFGTQRRTCERIQLSEAHTAATSCSPQMSTAIPRGFLPAPSPASTVTMPNITKVAGQYHPK